MKTPSTQKPIEIEVQWFAVLRDAAGKSHERVTVAQGDTAAHVYTRFLETYQFKLHMSELRVAINDEFAQFDRELCNADRVVFIPPVAGG